MKIYVELSDLDNLAKHSLSCLDSDAVVFLHGSLGAGKTTFVRSILRMMGYQGATKSPTYTLVEPYEINGQKVYHFDLYRLCEPEELEYMGIRDYLDESALILIEWPDKGEGYLPQPDLEIFIEHADTGRILHFVGKNESMIQSLVQHLSPLNEHVGTKVNE